MLVLINSRTAAYQHDNQVDVIRADSGAELQRKLEAMFPSFGYEKKKPESGENAKIPQRAHEKDPNKEILDDNDSLEDSEDSWIEDNPDKFKTK